MLNILETATIAQEQEDWSLVNQCLQKLPLNNQDSKLQSLEEAELDKILNLALGVLMASDFQQRWEVAKIFPKLGKIAIAPLIKILEDEKIDIDVRWFVGRTLAQFDDPAVVISLVNLLKHTEDEELSIMASKGLANIGAGAIQALSSLLKDNVSTEKKLKLLAVQALAHIRSTEIVVPMLEVVNDTSPEVRASAIEALSSFFDQRISAILVAALKDKAARVRKEAVIALGLRYVQQEELNLVSELQPLLYDLDSEVCQQAAIALGRMGTNDAAEALFRVLKSPATPDWLKLDIVRGLSWIETPQTLEYLQQGLRWSSVEVCQEIVVVLGAVELQSLKRQATQILIDFLYSEQSALKHNLIKQVLAMSLGELGESEAINPLLELAEDSEQIVKLHAIAALKKFKQ